MNAPKLHKRKVALWGDLAGHDGGLALHLANAQRHQRLVQECGQHEVVAGLWQAADIQAPGGSRQLAQLHNTGRHRGEGHVFKDMLV